MSLFVRYAEPWIVLPESRYDISDRKIDKYMDEDFSLYMRVKIFPDRMIPNEEGFAFARSGKHSGLSFYKVKDKSLDKLHESNGESNLLKAITSSKTQVTAIVTRLNGLPVEETAFASQYNFGVTDAVKEFEEHLDEISSLIK